MKKYRWLNLNFDFFDNGVGRVCIFVRRAKKQVVDEDEQHRILRSLHTSHGEMLTNIHWTPICEVNIGDTVFASTNPRRQIIVSNSNTGKFENRPLSVSLKSKY